MLGKVIDAMTAPRRMREADPATRDRSFDWRHRRGLAFAELLEHLPTDHLHNKSAATVVVTIDHTVLAGAMKAADLDTDQALSPEKPDASPATPASSPPSSAAGPSPSTSAGRARLFSASQRSPPGLEHDHLRRLRLRTPLRLVRAAPPEALGQRRPHRPRQRDPAVPSTPPVDPRRQLSTTRQLPDGSLRFSRRT